MPIDAIEKRRITENLPNSMGAIAVHDTLSADLNGNMVEAIAAACLHPMILCAELACK